MILPKSNPVLNDVAASAADLSLSNRVLIVSNVDTDGNAFIPMDYPSISASGGILKYLEENVYVATVTYTAASNTTYSFNLKQTVNGVELNQTFSVTSDSTGTDAEIATAILASVNGSQYAITATGAASPVTLTADAGSPLFYIEAIENVTVANGMATYAPDATAADAITAVIAPDGTAATALAGTTTITVTTLAAHLLVPGDQVTIGSVATKTLSFLSGGKVITGAAGGTFTVATVPTSTTFTLEGVTGTSGNNSGTITITTTNCCFVQTAAAQTGIDVGDQLTITGVATATLDGGTSGTYRVGAVASGDQRFKLENAALVGTNSGTIVIRLKESESRGLGSDLVTAGIDGAVSTNNYAQCSFTFSKALSSESNFGMARGEVLEQTLWINQSDAQSDDFIYALQKDLDGTSYTTPPLTNANTISVA